MIDEAAVTSWLSSHASELQPEHLDGKRISLVTSPEWSSEGIPAHITAPGADFFRAPALMIKRDYEASVREMPAPSEIPEEYLDFSSTAKGNVTPAQAISQFDPLFTTMPAPFPGMKDSRRPGNPIRLKSMRWTTLTFHSVTATAPNVELLDPIAFNFFVFDVKLAKKVSETWTYSPVEQFTILKDFEAFKPWIEAPKSVSMALSRPFVDEESADKLTDDLFLVCVLDRPCMKKAGAAVTSYYLNPKERARNEAFEVTATMSTEGWFVTFAYAAVKIADLGPQFNSIKFEHVLKTDEMNDAFLAHKLSKVRKKPVYLPLQILLACQPTGDQPVPAMRHLFAAQPHFELQWRHELVVSIKSASFQLKLGQKKNVVCEVTCKQGTQNLPAFNGREKAQTRCIYHESNPKFQDEIVVQLPWPLVPDMVLNFSFYHIDEKTAERLADEGVLGSISLPLLDKDAILAPGERKIQGVVDQKQKQLVSNLVLDVYVRSMVYSYLPEIDRLLRGDLNNDPIQEELSTIIKNLPPIMDVVIQAITDGKEAGFRTLLNLLSMFPVDKSDPRYTDAIKEAWGESEVQPIDHLKFYIRYCALRKKGQEKFFDNFIAFWVQMAKDMPVTTERQDLMSIPILLELLLKCLLLDPSRVQNSGFLAIINGLQVTVEMLRVAAPQLGRRVNVYLSWFYRDLSEFQAKGAFLKLVTSHLNHLKMEQNEYDRACFVDFLSSALTPHSLLILSAPMIGSDPYSCTFCTTIIPMIVSGLSFCEHTHSVMTIIVSVLRCFTEAELAVFLPAFRPLVEVYGKNNQVIREQDNHPTQLMFSFMFILGIAAKIDLSQVNYDTSMCLNLVLDLCDMFVKMPKLDIALGQPFEPDGHRRNTLALSGFPRPEIVTTSDCVWKRLAFVAEVIVGRVIELGSNVYVINGALVPLYHSIISSALFPSLRQFTIAFIRKHPGIVLNDPNAATFRMVKNIYGQLSADNVVILDELWNEEQKMFKTSNRATAFFMLALHKHHIDEAKLALLQNSKYANLAQLFFEIWGDLQMLNNDSEENHDYVSDYLLDMADFFIPSPDCRVKVLLELAHHHLKYQYVSEAAVAQLTAAAIVAEYLSLLKKLPRNAFSDPEHPANSFVVACPSASSEVCPKVLVDDTPKILGFCSSKYFCECGLIFLIQTAMDTCKRAQLFELGTKIHALLRPLAESRHLWKVLEKHFQNGAFSFSVLESFSGKSDRALGNYYRVEFQNAGMYLYRETQLANMWQVMEKLKARAGILAAGKPVVVLNEGEDLAHQSNPLSPDNYYVHVKFVEPFFTPEERKMRMTVFEQNHDVNRFYFDLPFFKGGQQIEHCWLKRTIITLEHPVPYLVSRIVIHADTGVKVIEYSPIEYNCQSLLTQVDRINDATKRHDFPALQPLIQGALLTQVNDGPKKMAEVFLTGAAENENEHTMALRKIFRKFLKATSRAVKVHGEWVRENPVWSDLQEQLEMGLNRLTSTLQPFLK